MTALGASGGPARVWADDGQGIFTPEIYWPARGPAPVSRTSVFIIRRSGAGWQEGQAGGGALTHCPLGEARLDAADHRAHPGEERAAYQAVPCGRWWTRTATRC